MRGRYGKTRAAAGEILGFTAAYLEQFGRPRKRPGQPREARDGMKLNLEAAISWSATQTRATKTAKDVAIEALVTETGWTTRLTDLDQYEQDTREVIRIVKRAAKALA